MRVFINVLWEKGLGWGGAGFEFFSGSCLLSVWCWQQDLWPHSHSRLVSTPLSPPHRPVRVFVHFLCVLFLSGSLPSPPAFPLVPCSVSQLALWLAQLSVAEVLLIKLIIPSSDVPVLFWFYLWVSVLSTCLFLLPSSSYSFIICVFNRAFCAFLCVCVGHVSAASMLMVSEWFFSQTLRIYKVWKVRRNKCRIAVFAEIDVFFTWLKWPT